MKGYRAKYCEPRAEVQSQSLTQVARHHLEIGQKVEVTLHEIEVGQSLSVSAPYEPERDLRGLEDEPVVGSPRLFRTERDAPEPEPEPELDDGEGQAQAQVQAQEFTCHAECRTPDRSGRDDERHDRLSGLIHAQCSSRVPSRFLKWDEMSPMC